MMIVFWIVAIISCIAFMFYHDNELARNKNKVSTKNDKIKKPLKKCWWFWIIVFLLTAGLVGSITDSFNDNSTSKNKTDQKATKAKQNTVYTDPYGDQTSIENARLLSVFTKVKLGDIAKEGQGGTSYKKVKKMLGSKPTNTSSSEVSGIESEISNWHYAGLDLSFTFVNKHVVGRSLNRLRWKRSRSPITRKSYRKLDNGTTSDYVLKKWGMPDEITQLFILGNYQTKYTWFTGIDGDLGSNVSVDFTGNKLTGKSQYGLK